MFKTFALSLVRHALTAGGSLLVAKGFADTSGADQLVGGGVVAFGLVWSYLEKRYVFLKS